MSSRHHAVCNLTYKEDSRGFCTNCPVHGTPYPAAAASDAADLSSVRGPLVVDAPSSLLSKRDVSGSTGALKAGAVSSPNYSSPEGANSSRPPWRGCRPDRRLLPGGRRLQASGSRGSSFTWELENSPSSEAKDKIKPPERLVSDAAQKYAEEMVSARQHEKKGPLF
ncbi:hypothetical protein ElyMa_002524400 [Elysia marginata]|uniref:Uncharacterized protein n=1 Tax=Elysia marginata TaxID=1093978 RepID=A0AAV4GS46_9GAST|nr:hypothetical protein ElyMa_002524400 [Elysia marginata]